MKRDIKRSTISIIKAIVIIGIILFILIKINNSIEFNDENLKNRITIVTNNKTKIYAHLTNYSTKFDNFFLNSFNNTSKVYIENKKKLSKVQFVNVNATELYIQGEIFNNENVYLKHAKLIFLDKDLNLISSMKLKLEDNYIYVPLTNAPKDQDVYLYIKFFPNYFNSIVSDRYITYCAKISL